jgi:hypothetical protein
VNGIDDDRAAVQDASQPTSARCRTPHLNRYASRRSGGDASTSAGDAARMHYNHDRRRSDRHLDIEDPVDRAAAARALAEGRTIGHPVANIYVLSAHPAAQVVRAVNVMKGRPPHQVGSVSTTRNLVPRLFDWSRLPSGLTRDQVLRVMDALWSLGPFGFRGPAAEHIPDHLSHREGDMRTVQVVLPGFRCPSNDFVARALKVAQLEFVFGTSGNHSRHLTGALDEPTHHTADGMAEDFGEVSNFALLRHRDDTRVRQTYPLHRPMSTTLLAFHQLAPTAAKGRPRLIVQRHGSLHVDIVAHVLQPFGLGLALAPGAHVRLRERGYDQRAVQAA